WYRWTVDAVLKIDLDQGLLMPGFWTLTSIIRSTVSELSSSVSTLDTMTEVPSFRPASSAVQVILSLSCCSVILRSIIYVNLNFLLIFRAIMDTLSRSLKVIVSD